MSVALITALSTGIPAVIGAIIALIQALRGKSQANDAQALALHVNAKVNDHITRVHDAFPIQPVRGTDDSRND